VRVELKISNTRAIVTQILQRELDLGMVGRWPKEDVGELEMSTYAEDEIVLVASPSHPLARRKQVPLDEVMAEGLVIREQGSATREAAEESFALLGVEPKVAIELGSNQAVKLAAQAGVGIGVISHHGIAAELKARLLQVLDVRGWRCTRPLTLVYLKDRHLSPAQRAFLELLEKEHPLPSSHQPG
jgi:DNA-binding transcriptional LysR family regulator